MMSESNRPIECKGEQEKGVRYRKYWSRLRRREVRYSRRFGRCFSEGCNWTPVTAKLIMPTSIDLLRSCV
jgi:hypothetical protein